MSKMSKRNRERHFKSVGHHHQFLQRITKTLYYGKLPTTERLSLPVTELAAELFSEAQHGRSLERLHCNDAAKISRNACVSPCSFVLAMLYLEQLRTCNPEYLQQIAPSELFLVSLMISSKFLHDDGEEDEVFIDEWAKSGGISIKELVSLEKEFLNAIQWEVFVHEREFWKKLGELEASLAKREGCQRGWFTYTELQNLMTAIDVANLIQCVATVTSVLLATYTVGVLTLLGSMFIVSNIPGNCLQTRNVYVENKLYLNIEGAKTENVEDINDTSSVVLTSLSNINCDTETGENLCRSSLKQHLDAADVLKTGIFLASIKTVSLNTNKNGSVSKSRSNSSSAVDESAGYMPWAWWISPTMDWLTKTSKMIEQFDFMPEFKRFTYDQYIDKLVANSKIMNLEDHIDKATKVRIQDQMERSWHVEWTDTLKSVFTGHKMLFCV